MAGTPGNKNAVGNSGGKSLQDRELASRVRSMNLRQIEAVLQGKLFEKDIAFHKALLLKLAGSVLPRLNEHSGENGDAIEHRIIYLPQREPMEAARGQTD